MSDQIQELIADKKNLQAQLKKEKELRENDNAEERVRALGKQIDELIAEKKSLASKLAKSET